MGQNAPYPAFSSAFITIDVLNGEKVACTFRAEGSLGYRAGLVLAPEGFLDIGLDVVTDLGLWMAGDHTFCDV